MTASNVKIDTLSARNYPENILIVKIWLHLSSDVNSFKLQ